MELVELMVVNLRMACTMAIRAVAIAVSHLAAVDRHPWRLRLGDGTRAALVFLDLVPLAQESQLHLLFVRLRVDVEVAAEADKLGA